jgi:alkaline phosphatase D
MDATRYSRRHLFALAAVPLFNGRDFSGWERAGNAIWTVEYGALAGRFDHGKPGPGYILTQQEYGDFRLKLDFFVSKGGNSGVYVREPRRVWGLRGDQRPAHGPESGYEIQIDYNDPDNPTGSFYGVQRARLTAGGEERWNSMEIEATGPRLRVWVEGQLVNEIAGARSLRGVIGLQSHGGSPHVHVVRFRNIQITPAPHEEHLTTAKVGEMDETSAIVWTRSLQAPRIRVRCAGQVTPWGALDALDDYARQFRIQGLQPGRRYDYTVEPEGRAPVKGVFETAPRPGDPAGVAFTVVTGMAHRDLDHPDGFHIFEAMRKLAPDFLVFTGDNVYYDNDPPLANTVELARYHWHRMFNLPRHVAFLHAVPAYWMKDDHDTLVNDCWPGRDAPKMRPLTFERGRQLFLEQVPMGERTWRTVRWGSRLQLWLPEGRDFRSPNTMPDGPMKTIWGAEQKAWIRKSVEESRAQWRIIVSPTPLVGPDRVNKGDNHANRNFQHEGDEIRRWIQQRGRGNTFWVCGDRHWQYHSVHPETGVQEFSCGPASDQHAGGSPGEDKRYHRFHRELGGFLSVTADASGLAFRFHDVHGAVMHEQRFKA